MTRMRTIAGGAGALLALVVVVVGIPLVLARVGAVPTSLPDPATLRQVLLAPDHSGQAMSVVLAALTWWCWATFTLSVARETLAAIGSRGRRPARPLPGLGWSARPAAYLVGAVVAMIVAAPVAATLTAPPALAAPTRTSVAHPSRASAPTLAAGPARQAATTTPTPPTPDTPDAAATAAPSPGTPATSGYTVARHDSLWSIADRQLGQPRRWVDILELNPHIGPDHVIHPGQVLTLPPPQTQPEQSVTVQPADTLSRIAARHGHQHWQQLWAANAGRAEPAGARFTDPNHIEPGWSITIPTTAASTQQAPAVTNHAADLPAPAQTPPQPAPEPAAAETEPASAAPSAPQEPPARDTDQQTDRPQVAAAGAFAAGGLVLAASVWSALLVARRQRWRHRTPGRGFAPAPAPLVAVERAASTQGAPAVDETTRVDEVLRRLAASDTPTLPLAAVCLTETQITVHFTDPVTLPDPWTPATDDRQHDDAGDSDRDDAGQQDQPAPTQASLAWTFPADAPTAAAGPDPADMTAMAPFPALVTLGTDGQRTWLLDLERAGVLTLTGDPQACADVARAIAAQLALTPWGEGVRTTLVGFGAQLVDVNPERLRYATDVQAPDVVAEAGRYVHDAITYAGNGDERDLPTVRRDDTEPEAWPPQVLLVTADTAHTTRGLRQLIDTHPARTGTAVIITATDTTDTDAAHPSTRPDAYADGELTGIGATGTGLTALVTADGTLTLAPVGLTLKAHRWDQDTAAGVAALLSHARDADTANIPPAAGPGEWAALADQAGALRPELVAPREAPAVHEADTDADACLLPLADQVYVQAAPNTVEDLHQLAPAVRADVSDAVQECDPQLDADLAAWFDPHCLRPRLTLLGPMTIRTPDDGVGRRLAYYTEVIAYLATRPHGATVDQLADAFTIARGTARKYVHVIRQQLGNDPDTAKPYLPDADRSPAARTRGVPTYQVDGILVDADLFRRLRLRGQARGPDGIADLATALQLVTGEPFSQMRPGGGEWVIDGDRIDHHLTHAITDVAHLVTTHALAVGDLTTARAATDIARVAAPYEEITRLDSIAVDNASGDTAAARATLRDGVCNRSDDNGPPMELSERTQRILTQHADWLTRAS